MLAIAANITMTNYGKRHFCRSHGVMIDKKHINKCNLLSRGLEKQVTHYNQLLEKTSIYDMEREELHELVEHYEQLRMNIDKFKKVRSLYRRLTTSG